MLSRFVMTWSASAAVSESVRLEEDARDRGDRLLVGTGDGGELVISARRRHDFVLCLS